MPRAYITTIRACAALFFAAGLLAASVNAAPAADAGKSTGAATPSAAPAAAQVAAAQVAVAERLTLVKPAASIELMAEPSKVWKRLTSAEGLAAFGLTGDKKRGLDKVGDNVHGTLAGDAGNVVVTHAAKETEWRAAFEPDKGNYVCSIRFTLKPQGKNTLLTFADWYSDEKPAMIDQNLKATEKSMQEGLARFKALVEKASAAGND